MIVLGRVLLGLALSIGIHYRSEAQISAHFTSTGKTVGTTSVQVAPARQRGFLMLQNQSATATIYCTDDGTAAVAAPTAKQITLFPGTGPFFDAVVPNNEYRCVATAAGTPLTVSE